MRRFFLKLIRRRQLEQDLDAELAFHKEMAARSGNPIPLGNTSVLKEQAFDLWRFNSLENLWRDVRQAFRLLTGSPGFTLSALLSLALGIGVNAMMFSLVSALLLNEPSVRDARSLVAMRLGGNSHTSQRILDTVSNAGVFAEMVAEGGESYINWNDGVQTKPLFSQQGTKNYFTALGIPVLHGRGWTEADDDNVAVLRYRFWRSNFGGDPSVLGRAIQLDGRAYTVIGVLPENHRSLTGFGYSPDIYVPLFVRDTPVSVYGRMKPGSSLGETTAAMRTVGSRLDREFPERYWKYETETEVTPVAGFERIRLRRQALTVALFVLVLLALAGLVLLIACVNVAGLLLARASARRQEIAIRLSLGASRGRLLQQLLAESLLLSALGATLGFLLAFVSARALASIPLPTPIPMQLQIEPDWRVATYAAVLAVLSALVSGLWPAWQTVRESLTASMHRERRLRSRRILVAAQVAVSFVVLSAGALFVRNLFYSSSTSPGFDVRRTLRAEVFLPPNVYRSNDRILPFVDRALAELRAVPGVESVAAARIIPFTDGIRNSAELRWIDQPDAAVQTRFHWNAVTPDYFASMDIPILSGRTFQQREPADATPVIVNTVFVERYLSGRQPIGATFRWGHGVGTLSRIVAVVGSTKNMTIGEDAMPQVYESLYLATSESARIQFVARSSIPAGMQITPLGKALRAVEPAAGVTVQTMFASIGMAFLPSQVGALLMGITGVIGLLLAAIGLYGVIAYAVVRRTREIGIRMAIGASRGEISRMVLTDAARLLAWGLGIGLAIAVIVTRPMAIFLAEGVSASDPATFGIVVAVLVTAGVLAVLGPARRAMRVDPSVSLRQQ